MRTSPAPGGSWRGAASAIAGAILTGCAGTAEDTGPVALPAEDTSAWREDTGTFPFDTADTAPADESPAHTLTVRHEGTWTLGGAPADPSSVTGTLTVTELLDGDAEAPACVETFALVGERAPTDCAGCAYTFVVQHTLVTTEGACRAPERPTDGEERSLGYAAAEQSVYWDWYDTGVWVPIWSVETDETGDLLLAWETTLGVAIEEEE